QDDLFSSPYSTVEVSGDADGEPLTAEVEVLPPADHSLVYFVDAGRGGDAQDKWYSTEPTSSAAFEAAQTLADESLRNAAPAEASELAAFNKYELGFRTNSESVDFGLALDPGTYTLSSGFYEFYAAGQDRFRQIDPTLIYEVDGDTETDKLGTIKLSTTADK